MIVKQNIHRIQTLLSDSAVDVNAQDENECSPLAVAVLMNKPEMTKLLLQHKDIQVNTLYDKDDSALHYAVSFGFVECVRVPLSHLLDQIINAQ